MPKLSKASYMEERRAWKRVDLGNEYLCLLVEVLSGLAELMELLSRCIKAIFITLLLNVIQQLRTKVVSCLFLLTHTSTLATLLVNAGQIAVRVVLRLE